MILVVFKLIAKWETEHYNEIKGLLNITSLALNKIFLHRKRSRGRLVGKQPKSQVCKGKSTLPEIIFVFNFSHYSRV